ncbi:MAG: sulfatase-like hydrolase/transferase [candidate division Zixibacteria bacterium]|nr:sulfatase-like hydrolase/transferase [candidate division Zixibacteria bacterium]
MSISNPLSRLKSQIRYQLEAAIIPGILGGILAGFIEALLVGLITEFWSSSLFLTGLVYYSITGFFIAVVSASLVATIAFVFNQHGTYNKISSIYFASVSSYLLAPKISWLMSLSHFIKPEYGWIDGLKTTAVFYGLFLIFLVVFWIYRRITHVMHLNWKKTGLVSSLISIVLLTLIVIVWSEQKVEFMDYDEQNHTKVKDKPYVFLIVIDALRYDWISPYGFEIKTPNLQKLAEDGILYKNSFSQCCWTRPSIASMFTSLYPSQHGVETFFNIINSSLPTLAESMNKAGYYTIGFHNNLHISYNNNFQQGFNYYKYLFPLKEYPSNPEDPRLKYANSFGNTLSSIKRKFGWRKSVHYWYIDAVSSAMEVNMWIDENLDKKFFMFIHLMDPHGPYFEFAKNGDWDIARPPMKGAPYKSEKHLRKCANYYKKEIKHVDKALGDLIENLKEKGIYDNSIILLTSDHGQEFDDHGGSTHGKTLYDEMIHTPLIIKLPYSEKKGTIDTSLVQSIDIAPTLSTFVHADIPAKWEGVDIFSGAVTNWTIAQRIKFGKRPVSIRNLSKKLYIAYENIYHLPPLGYYNIRTDPLEQDNLADNQSYGREVIEMKDTLDFYLNRIAANEVSSPTIELDEETRDRLKALGYVE